MKVGILGLQGDVREHRLALTTAGATPSVVKHERDLDAVDGLVIPGGESTTIGKLLDRFGLLDPIRVRASTGMPLYGTCAGAILMAARIAGAQDAPHRLGLMDIEVQRNAYGRQVDSFEADLDVDGLEGPFRAVFIRAPVITTVGEGVEILARLEGSAVLVRQDNLLASTFHPEMTADARIHEIFLEMASDSGRPAILSDRASSDRHGQGDATSVARSFSTVGGEADARGAAGNAAAHAAANDTGAA